MRIKQEVLEQLKKNPLKLKEAMDKHGIPGGDIAVLVEGEVDYYMARGERDGDGRPLAAGTLFESASLTKSLFATLVMRLAEEGVLQLNKPIVEQYDHEPWSKNPAYDAITPRHVLCHGSGLPGWEERPMDMLFTPGEGYSYSGEGYYLLQHMVEALTGTAMNELFRERFYRPWGMQWTEADWTPEVGQAMSYGFDCEGKVSKIRNCHDDEGVAPEPNAAWSLYSCSADYARFLSKMIKEKGGLTEASFEEMTSHQNQATYGVSWGLGFGLVDEATSVLWHWGDNSGFKNFSIWDKETGDGVVIHTNCDRGMDFYMELLKELTDGQFYDQIRNFIEEAE